MSKFRDTYGDGMINSVGCTVSEVMDATLEELRKAMDEVLELERKRITKEIVASERKKIEESEKRATAKTKPAKANKNEAA